MEDKKCTICLDDMESSGTSKPSNCKHVFHTDCIKKWAETKCSCPTCRASFNELVTTYTNEDGKVLTKTEKVTIPVSAEETYSWTIIFCALCSRFHPPDINCRENPEAQFDMPNYFYPISANVSVSIGELRPALQRERPIEQLRRHRAVTIDLDANDDDRPSGPGEPIRRVRLMRTRRERLAATARPRPQNRQS